MTSSEKFVHLLMRFLVPGAARQLERDGTLDHSQYMVIQDRGADVTVFCLSGLAAMFAGLPVYEFRRMLPTASRDMNLVFIRDVRRMFYQVSPDGEADGGAFFESEIRRVRDELGASHNVLLGASGGGAAAFLFGSRLGFDQLITFSPAFPVHVYNSWRNRFRSLFDLPKLFCHPKGYFEVFFLTFLVCPWAIRRIVRVTGKSDSTEILEAYRNASPRPRATVIHGHTCWPDVDQAAIMRQFPEVKCIPVESARHNCAGDLKKRGELAPLILNELAEGLAARRG